MLILWSIPVLTLYLLLVRFSSSSSERHRCNVQIFCTTEHSIALLVDGASSLHGWNKSSFGTSCQQIVSMSSRPEVTKSCRQGSLVCAACLRRNATMLDKKDKLTRSVFVYPMKGGAGVVGQGQRREMFLFRGPGGGTHLVQTSFPQSVREAAPSSFSSRHMESEDEEGKEEEKEADNLEASLCLALDRMVKGVSNLSAYFALYPKDLWPAVASDPDVPIPRTLTDEADNITPGTRALLGISKKAHGRGLVQKSMSLLMFLPSKFFLGHDRGYHESIKTYTHASVSVIVGKLLSRPRTRQLMQDYNNDYLTDLPPPPPPPPPEPPAPPPDQLVDNPYFNGIVDGLTNSDNATYDETLAPVINGPTSITIANVSVYLTGIFINNFSISSPPNNPNVSNTTEYQVVLQVDAGSLLVLLDPSMLPSTKHQVSVGNFWIAIPEDDWNIGADEHVPGAGIQWQCVMEDCNIALSTLSYGKGLGTGRKSKTVLTMLVYPTIQNEPIAVAKAIKIVTMDIAGAGAWFTIFQYTKIFYTTSLGVLGMGLSFVIILCCILGCCVCWQNHKEKEFNKMQIVSKVEDATYDETRVFNPFWIPSAAVKAGDEKFIIIPNPKFFQQLQSEHLTRMQSIGVNSTLETMQFLVAAQVAAAASDINVTTIDEGGIEDNLTAAIKTSTTTSSRSMFGSPRSSASNSSKSSRTSGTSHTNTSKPTRFSLEEESENSTPDDTDSTVGTPVESEDSD